MSTLDGWLASHALLCSGLQTVFTPEPRNNGSHLPQRHYPVHPADKTHIRCGNTSIPGSHLPSTAADRRCTRLAPRRQLGCWRPSFNFYLRNDDKGPLGGAQSVSQQLYLPGHVLHPVALPIGTERETVLSLSFKFNHTQLEIEIEKGRVRVITWKH